MKAVNLIPAEERRNSSAGGRSGGAAYALLGILAVLVLVAAAYALSARQVSHKRSQLARLNSSAAAAEAQAQRLTAFTDFTSLRAKREQTVKSIAASRFDWAHALHEVARTIPANAWLTSLTGTVAPGVNVGGGSTSSLRGALPVPAIDISGCTTSQKSVARMLVHMRQIDGVQQVALQSSAKSDSAGGGAGGGSGGGGSCASGSDQFPAFQMTIFFNAATPLAAPAAPTAAPAAATTAPSTSSTGG
jgi:Tfp pilus assembly protein PilN